MVILIPNQLPPAFIDRNKVKQILFNLLINAAKYSPRGGETGDLPRFDLQACSFLPAPGQVRSDNGLVLRIAGIGAAASTSCGSCR